MSRKADHNDPVYKRIYNDLSEKIKDGSLGKLSSVSIGKAYSVNRNTADKVISLLETNGWVRRVPKKGTFPVTRNQRKMSTVNILYSFNSFNDHFLNSYPYVNAKLIETICQSPSAKQCNINILLLDPANSYEQTFEKLSSLGDRNGFVILDPERFPQLISMLRKEKMPYMTFAPESLDINRAAHDSYHGAFRSIEHLIKVSGRKHIAFLSSLPAPSANAWTASRFQAYTDALAKNAVPFRESYVLNCSANQGGVGLINNLRKNREIDAVFAASFEVGRRIVDALKLSEIRIPEDIAVIVFHDLPEFSLSTPAITAVRAPLEKIGLAIIDNLLDMINFGFRDDVRVTFNDELILRDSC
jgi:DNA-binding LacI/PurR family transcriptional regulator